MANIGAYDRRIRIEQPVPDRGSAGSHKPSYAHFATVWSFVKPISGREGFSADQVTASAVNSFKVRWQPGITDNVSTKMIILYDGKIWDIQSVNEQSGRREGIEIMAKARDDD